MNLISPNRMNAAIHNQSEAGQGEAAPSSAQFASEPVISSLKANHREEVTPIEYFFRNLIPETPNDSSIKQMVEGGKGMLNKNPELSINDCLWWPGWKNVTLLMSMVANGESKAAIALINELGADPFIEDCNQKNLLHLLVAKGRKRDTCRSCENQYPLFKMILQGDNLPVRRYINTQDKYGLTPLHYACARQDKQYIEPLIRVGADPAIKDINGNDCLDILCMEEQSRINIIALAVAVETMRFTSSKLSDNYTLKGDELYFFQNTPVSYEIRNSPPLLESFVYHNLSVFADLIDKPSDKDLEYLTRLLESPEIIEAEESESLAESAPLYDWNWMCTMI